MPLLLCAESDIDLAAMSRVRAAGEVTVAGKVRVEKTITIWDTNRSRQVA